MNFNNVKLRTNIVLYLIVQLFLPFFSYILKKIYIIMKTQYKWHIGFAHLYGGGEREEQREERNEERRKRDRERGR